MFVGGTREGCEAGEEMGMLKIFTTISTRVIGLHRVSLQALAEASEKHSSELEELKNKLESEKAWSLSQMQTSFTAEKQATFNEALDKVTLRPPVRFLQYDSGFVREHNVTAGCCEQGRRHQEPEGRDGGCSGAAQAGTVSG